ncbi:AP3-complex subunit beta-A [Nicotiana tabacum]|uniref:AP-3 complex subunit beta n=2 Tax=Nicotiana TaxID=4085 RepID=A0A1S4DMS9_TOBAC|nr:PREDICTED: AP3-complex subunit beta-A [Nicotiana sylvestris]XP_016514723.1 PREDICTED: AP3-complex subunit beta-A-like [Nicotiana tabacum]
MFTQFGATADSLSKASTLVFRIGTDAHLYDDPDDVNIAPLLDSKFDSEKCEALKRLLALIAQGCDVSNFFPQVVKNVASQSMEVKKLVYLYLLHYAEKRPNEALLSINCFQKDLGDPNPLVRAWALRTMAGIRLHVIAPLVLVAVGKCARDPSVYVRKCAANALPKLHDLRLEEDTSTIEELVGILLNDNSPGVVGAAAAAFASICPNNYSFIGRNYRRLCETLPDVEEWGQIVLIGILIRYVIARHGLVKESLMAASHSSENCNSENKFEIKESTNDVGTAVCESKIAEMVFRSYLEGPDKYLSCPYSERASSVKDFSDFTSAKSNDDVKVLLQCTLPLLWNQNSAVVLAAAGMHWIMAPKEEIKRIVKPLLFLLRSSNASKYVVLCNIQVFAKAMPTLFVSHFEDFFVSSTDPYQVKALKLDILSLIATHSSISPILNEFQDYIKDPYRRFAADAVAAIGLCAERLPNIASTCLERLLILTSSEISDVDIASTDEEAVILIQAINSIKTIIKHEPSSHDKVIVHLARKLDSIRVPSARAIIIWMLGEYNSMGHIIPKVLPTVLKYLAWTFSSEAPETKLQILNAMVKVLLQAKGKALSTFKTLLNYVLELAKCDLNYDIRDRARVLRKFLAHYVGTHELEESAFQAAPGSALHVLAGHLFGRETKLISSEPLAYRFYLPGSLSQMVLHAAPGYENLPQPCSFYNDTAQESNMVKDLKQSGNGATQSESYETDDADTVSGSLNEESTSGYNSTTGSSGTRGSHGSGSVSDDDEHGGPLIHLSDSGNALENQPRQRFNQNSDSNDLGELMAKRALDSWLDDNPVSTHNLVELNTVCQSLARISIGDICSRVKRKSYTLLDPANGNGLSVKYTFSSEVSSISPLLVCIQVSFSNSSVEAMSNLLLVEEDSGIRVESSDLELTSDESPKLSVNDVPTLVPMEEIAKLEPGQIMQRILQARFHHHLLPLKLLLWCNGKKYPVKLRPDIGYFLKPLLMEIDVFSNKESQLPGMFEYIRRCTFVDHIEELNKLESPLAKDNFLVICENLALKVLSNANLYLVSVDMPVGTNLDDTSGLRLRFSGEILSNSIPCLITITVEGKCSEPLDTSVKVNCEETVFGLNFLNRVVNFLTEPARL